MTDSEPTPPASVEKLEARSFWSERFLRFGHTGWKRVSVYAYDQQERLAIVENAIIALRLRSGAALDFGCGSGDFTRVLLRQGFRVWAHDPHVRPSFHDERLHFVSVHDELLLLPEKFSLILCVTVLDHLVSEKAFLTELRTLRSLVREDGCLLLLEYATDGSAARASHYQAFRSFATWQRALGACGWSIETAQPVPHPEAAPSIGYRRYARSLGTRALGRIADRGILVKPLSSLLNQRARYVFQKFGVGSVTASPLKLMLCRPVS